MYLQLTNILIVLSQHMCCLHVSARVTHLQDIHVQRNSGCWFVKHVSLKSLYRITLIFIHKYWSFGSPDYVNVETVFNNV